MEPTKSGSVQEFGTSGERELGPQRTEDDNTVRKETKKLCQDGKDLRQNSEKKNNAIRIHLPNGPGKIDRPDSGIF